MIFLGLGQKVVLRTRGGDPQCFCGFTFSSAEAPQMLANEGYFSVDVSHVQRRRRAAQRRILEEETEVLSCLIGYESLHERTRK